MRIALTLTLGILLGLSQPGFAATNSTTTAFPHPGEPGILRIMSGEGDITVTGYSGTEVVITYRSDRKLDDPNERDERARGLTRLTGNSFRIYTVEEENAIVINRSMTNETDLDIQVPVRTSVLIGSGTNRNLTGIFQSFSETIAREVAEQTIEVFVESNGDTLTKIRPQPMVQSTGFSWSSQGSIIEGDITVTNVTGNIEAGTIDGDITLTGISGTATASTADGDITVDMRGLTGDTPLSFSTVDGDIDATLPSNIKANLRLRSVEGDIYSNFDIEYTYDQPSSVIVRTGRDEAYLPGSSSNQINGTVNGGGRQITLNTVDGDIYLRKGE